MIHQVTFDNTRNNNLIPLASGHISLSEITFVNQGVVVTIEAKTGEIAFCDGAGTVLLTATAPTPTAGDEKFSEVQCLVEGDRIRLGFPQYTYKDNYPHCDGEHDRWTKTILDFDYVCYDYKTNQLV